MLVAGNVNECDTLWKEGREEGITHVVDSVRLRAFLQQQLHNFHVTAVSGTHEGCPAILHKQHTENIK